MPTKLVCFKCKADWQSEGSPAICPDCGQDSVAIAVEDTDEDDADEPIGVALMVV